MLKAIHAGEHLAAAREKAIRVIEKRSGLRLSRAAEPVEAAAISCRPILPPLTTFAGPMYKIFDAKDFGGVARLDRVAWARR
jgi:hypothetical protein